jgi:hypothetical protein
MGLLDQYEQSRNCACGTCSQLCRHRPGALAPGDLERIAAAMDRQPDDPRVLQMFEACADGAIVLVDGQPAAANVIRPRMRRGQCVFLDGNGDCRINTAKPFECRVMLPCNADNDDLSDAAQAAHAELCTRHVTYIVHWAMVHTSEA